MAPGSTIWLVAPSPTSTCNNSTSVLVYQNQQGGELQVLCQQTWRRVKTPPILMNTSGVYCVYQNCTTTQMDWCCIKVTGKNSHNCMFMHCILSSLLHNAVPSKIQIQFPENLRQNAEENGSCIASAWPRPLGDEMLVYARNASCAMKMLPPHHTDAYTTVINFTMYASTSCTSIVCLASSMGKEKSINICKYTKLHITAFHILLYIAHSTTIPTSATTNDLTDPATEEESTTEIHHQHGGAPGTHRKTMWIIVLTVFNIALSSILGF